MLGKARSFGAAFFDFSLEVSSVVAEAEADAFDRDVKEFTRRSDESAFPFAGPGRGVNGGGARAGVASTAGVGTPSFQGLSTFRESERKARVCDEIRRNSTSMASDMTASNAV